MNLRTTLGGLSTRQRLIAALGVVVVVVAVVLAITLSGSGGSASSDAAASSASVTGSGAPATTSAGAVPGSGTATASVSVDPNQPPPSLPAVRLDATADAGTGVTSRLASIESVTAKAGGPGQIAGPALRVTVRIKNGSSADISLDSVAVNLSYGADNTPGSPVQDTSSAPFTGSLPAGDEAEGVYVFSVPKDSRNPVTVEVGYQAGAPLMVFSGPVD